jgi:hypothetical protein
MAELADVHGSGASKRAKMGKKVRWMRLDVLDLMVPIVMPETRRKFTGDEALRRRSAVNVGNSVENEIGRGEWFCGRARSPGTSQRGRLRRRMAGAAGL